MRIRRDIEIHHVLNIRASRIILIEFDLPVRKSDRAMGYPSPLLSQRPMTGSNPYDTFRDGTRATAAGRPSARARSDDGRQLCVKENDLCEGVTLELFAPADTVRSFSEFLICVMLMVFNQRQIQ